MAGPGESQCNCNEQDDTRLEMGREGSWGQSVPTSVYHEGYRSDLCSEKSFWLLSGSELGAGRWEAVLCGVISKAVAVERDVPPGTPSQRRFLEFNLHSAHQVPCTTQTWDGPAFSLLRLRRLGLRS